MHNLELKNPNFEKNRGLNYILRSHNIHAGNLHDCHKNCNSLSYVLFSPTTPIAQSE